VWKPRFLPTYTMVALGFTSCNISGDTSLQISDSSCLQNNSTNASP
jgi:hypothetical protein